MGACAYPAPSRVPPADPPAPIETQPLDSANEDSEDATPGETELDYAALESLIAQKLEEQAQAEAASSTGDELASSERLAGDVPVAAVTANLSAKRCLSTLRRHGVKIERPDFETPHVDTPLLLAGPIEGVEIGPRSSRADRTQEVMDCRLALALVGLARSAAALGVRKILTYSTYRLSHKPPQKGHQHQRGLAIDIGWLELATGERVSVLDSFPRHDGQPPCKTVSTDEAGELLQRFVCQAHADKLFQVMLTPNANREHHNHFHFDLTPDATWYIFK